MAAEVLKFLKGMFKNTGPIDQPDNTYRDALNAILEINTGTVSNEFGNALVTTMKFAATVNGTNYDETLVPVGQISLPNDNFLIFTVGENNSNLSCIVYVDNSVNQFNNTTSTVIFATDDAIDIPDYIGHLDFDVTYPITGEFRISPNGDVLTYFTDNKFTFTTEPNTGIEYIAKYNPPRVLNVSKQIAYIKTGGVVSKLYDDNSNKVSSLNIFMDAGRIPEFATIDILKGGGVVSGAYYLGLAYADKDLTETNVLVVSNPVYIVPTDDGTFPMEMISGAVKESQTSKSILWRISKESLNTDYKYIVPYIIQRVGNEMFASKMDYLENTVPTGQYTLDVVYSGLETSARSAVEEVILDKVKYLTAKSITQLDNKLYMANLTGRKDLGFQRFANGIELEVITDYFDDFDPRHYDIFNLNEGYAKLYYPDQVPSISAAAQSQLILLSSNDDYRNTITGKIDDYVNTVIRPIQENGHRAYRDPKILFEKKTFRRGEVYAFYISLVLKDGSETYAYHIPGRKPISDHPFNFEQKLMSEASSTAGLNVNGDEIANADPNAKVYQYLDTSIFEAGVSGSNATNTGYWENENEFYPDSPDFDIWKVDNSGEAYQVDTLRGKNVRHHKMPSNHNPDFSYISKNTTTGATEDYSTPNIDLDTDASGGVDFKETIRILGFKLRNISIPKFILNQIQGYKIYYAKRTQGNKTVIGQGGIHPGQAYLASNLSAKTGDAVYGPYFNMWYMAADHPRTGVIQEDAKWTDLAYLSNPVVKFHDFSLLRKKPTLTTATHIDLQYVVTMQNWRGGYKGALSKSVSGFSGGNDKFYITFKSGYGDDEYSWTDPQLGNMYNFDVSSSATTYNIPGPRLLWGQVFIGAKYNDPIEDVDLGWGTRGIPSNTTLASKQSELITNRLQTIFSVEPEGASYLSGVSFLKNGSTTAFKGATYIHNRSGDSAIVLGLKSGVPALFGYGASGWDLQTALKNTGRSYPEVMKGRENILKTTTKDGRPNVYLANLCSAKTDVFEPFDQQPLVSTGYYQAINVDSRGLETEDVILKGVANYYTGANSWHIYGGDTYICRYGYRITAQPTGFQYFKRGATTGGVSYIPGHPGAFSNTIWGDIPLSIETGKTFDENVLAAITSSYTRRDVITSTSNWVNAGLEGSNVYSTIFQFVVESDDNLNYRHAGDVQKGILESESMYFDKFTASEVLYKSPLKDLSKMDHLLYEEHFSAVQDIRITIPFPKRDKSTNLFPNRVIRSVVQDGNFNDTYRYILGFDYKDFAQHKGPITNIVALNALLWIHTEKSLFRTKGKQTMELTDATQAYIGSGDLFAQEPDEFVQSSEGYLGSYNKMGSLVTKDGYVFVSRKTKRIFLINDKVQDLTALGLDSWSREHIPFDLESYGYSFEDSGINTDAPTADFGFLISYDPLFKRIIVTKRELVPTATFTTGISKGTIILINNTFYTTKKDPRTSKPIQVPIDIVEDGTYFVKGGWTLSFSTDYSVWSSRHSYIPPLYGYNSKFLYSFDPNQKNSFYVHNDLTNPGRFYGTVYNFEVDCLFTGEVRKTAQGGVINTKTDDKIYPAFSFVVDVVSKANASAEIVQQFSPGFTSFYVWNTNQLSTENQLVYLSNLRKVDRSWVTNDFRDASAITFNQGLANDQIDVQGNYYNGTYFPSTSVPMFLSEGVINPSYIDSNKPWYQQRKFVDKFFGVRLISNNKSKNLVSLYTVSAASRTSNR